VALCEPIRSKISRSAWPSHGRLTRWKRLRTIAACCHTPRARSGGSPASFGSIGEVAITGMARDTDLAADHALARVDGPAPRRADAHAVPAEARTPDAGAVAASSGAGWRRLTSLV
jgi:hypothetical protein